MSSPGARLRSLVAGPRPLLVPGCGDALSARLIEAAGFPATCLSGAWAAALRGFVDAGLITLPEMAASARSVADAVSIPVLADVDTGFGGALNVRRCVREFEAAGVASIQIEDQGEPKRCGLAADKIIVRTEEMVEKIRVAASARRTELVILGRTDALASEGIDATIVRARAYVGAGADMLYVEAITNSEEAQRVAEAFPDVPLVFNQTPASFTEPIPVSDLAEWGFSLVYFSTQVLLAALDVQQRLLAQLGATGACDDFEERMLSIDAFFEILPDPEAASPHLS
jgi:2-methylisocitrate lyase-like PEP mutase family enzyme